MLLAAAVVLVAFGYGGWRLAGDGGRRPANGQGEGGFAVEVVRGDWSSLDRERSDELLERMVDQTGAAVGGAEITVWPEASLRVLPTTRPQSARRLYQLARDSGRDLVFGAPRLEAGKLHNSLYLLRPQATDFVATYDKRRLVPLAEAHFVAGGDAPPLRTGRDRTLAPLLCFEALFPDLAVRAGVVDDGVVDLFVNPTNDVRVGRGAEQQAAMAVFRAVENGIPLLRVANRGPSVLVDGYGRILARAGGWGAAIWQVPPALPATPYRVSVDWLRSLLPRRAAADGPLAWLCLAFVVCRVVSELGRIAKRKFQIPES